MGDRPGLQQPSRQQRRALQQENLQWPPHLRQVPRELWPHSIGQVALWRSRWFLVQVFAERDGIVRLSICRTTVSLNDWQDGISWDDLQRLKSESGYGDHDAVEVYPAEDDVVNVANMRHLWVMPKPLSFVWRGREHG